MKILTWNIRQGGGSRIPLICDELTMNSDSDIIILAEYRNNENGLIIKDHLTKLGFDFFYSPFTESDDVNTVFAATKHSCEFNSFQELHEHQHRVISIRWSNFYLLGTYFPQQKKKKVVFQFLYDLVKRHGNDSIMIIGGDLNTGLPFIDEEKNTFYCSDNFAELQEKEMSDTWRLINGSEKQYSWYHNSGTGFRIDHFLISTKSEKIVQDCYYNHEPRLSKIKKSDHSQLILKLSDEKLNTLP